MSGRDERARAGEEGRGSCGRGAAPGPADASGQEAQQGRERARPGRLRRRRRRARAAGERVGLPVGEERADGRVRVARGVRQGVVLARGREAAAAAAAAAVLGDGGLVEVAVEEVPDAGLRVFFFFFFFPGERGVCGCEIFFFLLVGRKRRTASILSPSFPSIAPPFSFDICSPPVSTRRPRRCRRRWSRSACLLRVPGREEGRGRREPRAPPRSSVPNCRLVAQQTAAAPATELRPELRRQHLFVKMFVFSRKRKAISI